MNYTQKIVSVLLLILLSGLVSCKSEDDASKNNSPGFALQKFYNLIQEKEFTKAADNYVYKGQKLSGDELEKMEFILKRAFNEYEKKGGINQIIIIEETIVGDYKTAKVKYLMVFNNGHEKDMIQAFEKSENNWCLTMITP